MSFFEHIFGDMPNGYSPHPGHESEEADTEEFYRRLDISKSARLIDIKRAYRKKARKLHPDKHPNEKDKYQNLFQELQEAYEVLSNENKRQLYDKGGIKLVKHHDRFKGSSPFFGGTRRPEFNRKKKSPAIEEQLEVTLEELYHGSVRKLKITRKTGEKGSTACKSCKGTGTVPIIQQIGRMVFEQRRVCNKCEGQGYKLKEQSVNIEFNIPVGGRHGEKVIIYDKGNKYPQYESGDIIIQLIEKKHKLFTRQGADLIINYELTIIEALCGYEIKLPHISGNILCINNKIDSKTNKFIPVQPGDLKVVYTKGMPQRFNTHVKGNLYINMKVKIPLFKQINHKKLNQLKQILPNTETNLEIKEELSKSYTNRKNINDINCNNNNNNNKIKNKKKNKKTKKTKKENSKKNNFDDDIVEEVECENVVGEPRHTPAATRGIHNEDENEDDRKGEYECHQM